MHTIQLSGAKIYCSLSWGPYYVQKFFIHVLIKVPPYQPYVITITFFRERLRTHKAVGKLSFGPDKVNVHPYVVVSTCICIFGLKLSFQTSLSFIFPLFLITIVCMTQYKYSSNYFKFLKSKI